MGATADPTTVPSCNGCEGCGTCEACWFNALPGLIAGGAQAVATITNANNQKCTAKLNAQTQLAAAQIRATSTQTIVMDVLIGVGIMFAIYVIASASEKK